MKIDKAISKRRVIEISLFNEEVFYSGVCLKASKKIWVIINYDFDTKCYDGYSIFRTKDIDYYTVFSKKEIHSNNKLKSFLIDDSLLGKVKTFYSAFKSFSSFKLFAFFDEETFDSYYVGKIIKLSKEKVSFRLLNRKAKWTEKVSKNFKDIKYFSFGTKYEVELMKKSIK